MLSELTCVLGVDEKHLKQLAMVWPTWMRHKPELARARFVVFYDWKGDHATNADAIRQVMGAEVPDGLLVPWPEQGVVYPAGKDGKWDAAQRVKMLAGFVHVAAQHVKTDWWLKIDTDTIATNSNPWLPTEEEFTNNAIIGQKWGFTKPAFQMAGLDHWAKKFEVPTFENVRPICAQFPELVPREPEQGRISHRRIISWCAFFRTSLARTVAEDAAWTLGPGQLPGNSQDGLMWYYATRLGLGVVRKNFKSCGWLHRSTMDNVKKASVEAMK